jgi:uncharacterized Rmd1/YagE family protein
VVAPTLLHPATHPKLRHLSSPLASSQELFDMLASELQNAHGNKLEWIIIWLIMIEVI